MLPSSKRLRRTQDITRVMKKGRVSSGRYLIVRFAANHLRGTRVAIVVGSRVSKLAVERNRLRRRISGILEPLFPSLCLGFDLLISAKPSAKNLPSPPLKDDLQKILASKCLL